MTPSSTGALRFAPRPHAPRTLRTIAILALIASTGCVNLSPHRFIGAGAEIWSAEVDGSITSGIDFSVGDQPVSLDGILGLNQAEETPVYNATIQLPNIWIEGRYFNLDYDDRTTLDTEIDFLGETFSIGTEVDSELELDLASVEVKFGIFETPEIEFVPQLQVGGIVGATFINLDASVSALPPFSAAVDEDLNGGTPTVGGIAVVRLPLGGEIALFADAEVSGIDIDYDEYEGSFLDLRARIGVELTPFATVGGGYQLYEIDFEDDDLVADFSADGFFLFLDVGF